VGRVLLFAETTTGGSGGRVFDVTAEGSVVLDDLDIYSEVGGDAALQKAFNVTVNDGTLNLGFVVGSADNPKVNGIQVVQVSQATNTPTVTPTPTATATPAPTNTPVGRPSITGLTNASGTLSGSVTMEATLNVPSGAQVVKVDFERTGPSFGEGYRTDTEPPYYFPNDSGLSGDPPNQPVPWDTTTTPNGSYRIAVTVYDPSGVADTEEFFFSVDNTPPATASPTAGPTATPTPVAETRTILGSYVNLQATEGSPSEPPDYDQTVYRPRQFTGTNYSGWDYLTLPATGINQIRYGDWFEINLNRAARVAVLWRGGAGNEPTWLTSSPWTRGTDTVYDSATYRVYTQDVSAGTLTVKAVKDASGGSVTTPYWILLSESGGVPSVTPQQRGSPNADPNETCPAWVHNQDKYRVTVDSQSYPSWHPQIDPEYWCYFRHEHGSDPSTFGDGTYKPAFGRSAIAAGVAENHEGFKVGVYSYSGYDWLLEQHFGTVNAQGAACNRFHEIGVAIAQSSGDRLLLADVMMMANMGKSIENTSHIPLNPVTCPGVNNGSLGSGDRLLPVQDGSDPGNPTFYEPWRFDASGTVIGLTNVFTFNTPDPIAICKDYTCSENVMTGLNGARRFYNTIGDFGVDADAAATTGVFYTNGFATQAVSGPGVGTLRQYVRPGTDARQTYGGDNHTFVTSSGGDTQNRFRARYRFEDGNTTGPQQGNTVELENSLSGAN
jgi:hypothetical protein